MSAPVDLLGQRFGRLLVVERAAHKRGQRYWISLCECGNTTTVAGAELLRGRTRSCGCLAHEKASAQNWKHGYARRSRRTVEYRTWISMKQRCDNPNCKAFADYGGRGIIVCERGRDSFIDFLADVGQRPPGLTLDRIDNDGPYAPGNVEWRTPKEQAAHRRPARAHPPAPTEARAKMSATRSGKPWSEKKRAAMEAYQARRRAGSEP
jgi:hypothetical protein